MPTAFTHVPVLLNEVVEALRVRGDGVYVDCTAGLGGHAAAVAAALGPSGRLVAIDRDPYAVAAVRQRLAPFKDRVAVVHANFSDLAVALDELGVGEVNGFLFDLGVSSPQLDDPARGFSYQHDAPLDMRMDPLQQTTTAYHLVNGLNEDELAELIHRYGEERWARSIARAIVRARRRGPLATTGELVEVIKAAIPAPARRRGGHPARRTFQALRMAVNDELGALRQGLEAARRRTAPAGRLVVISFHSLEDRLVKTAFRQWQQEGGWRVVTRKAVRPSEAEAEANLRSRSARLRVAERLGLSPPGSGISGATAGGLPPREDE